MTIPVTAFEVSPLSDRQRLLILITAFLGWMFAGVEMAIMIPATKPAVQSFLAGSGNVSASEIAVSADRWLSLLIGAFLLGGACGGILFGWLGDRLGRARAMGLSIICYSAITGFSYFAAGPEQLLVLRFMASMGIGGMWPCGVALATEASPGTSRAFLAGWIGTSANVGFLVLGVLMLYFPITQESWRWVLLFGGLPVVLGIFVLAAVPESPRWLAHRASGTAYSVTPIAEIFRDPLRKRTLLGIALGTVPLLGGWGSVQRIVAWVPVEAGQLKAAAQISVGAGAVVGSLIGGWFAVWLGPRHSYFLMSLASLLLSSWLFRGIEPGENLFLPVVFALSLVSTLYFGWLPYFLPALFPTRVRATGSGVSFNFGRIFSAAAVFATVPLSQHFGGDTAQMAAVTSLIYISGLVLAPLIPRKQEMGDV